MLLLSPPGVYQVRGDTRLLLSRLGMERLEPGCRVLDIGTGTGALAVAAARRGASVTAVDVSRRALATTFLNGLMHRRLIRIRRGDLVAPVSEHRFDVIVSNPPYVPSQHSQLNGSASRGVARAWDAGPAGRHMLDRICRQAPALLRSGGIILLVHSSVADISRTCSMLRERGLRTDVVDTVRQPFGPVMSSRARWFEEQGLIPFGQRDEEVAVIRGVQA